MVGKPININVKGVKTMKKESKKAIYARYGIEYENGKIRSSKYGLVNELLIDGNAKIGKGCFHFSTLPTNKDFTVIVNGKEYIVKGTCACDCPGCYATKGNYRFQSTKNSLGIRTLLAREELDFVERAIMAQIEADNIQAVRIHASGDFCGVEYVAMWQRIIKTNPGVKFWTYTKVKAFENAFDQFENANIVKSVIPGSGFNFGHCDYVESVYNKLTSENKTVHICKCGIDKNQHCTNCKGCSVNEYVLFIEHSTDYKAESDPNLARIRALIEKQENE